MKKGLCLLLVGVLGLLFCSCGESRTDHATIPSTTKIETKPAEKRQIYFLIMDPEMSQVYENIAKDYKNETGVSVKVLTAASNTYEQTLRDEIAKSEAATIFQLNGPISYAAWKDYCLDLKGTKLYDFLSDKSLALRDDGGVYGIPYAIQGYGILYNEEITDRYFTLENKQTTYSSMSQINSFEKLKELSEDMQAHKEELGIEGAFAATCMASGSQWPWSGHLANVPFYYEWKKNEDYDNAVAAGLSAKTVDFVYADNMKKLLDLYVDNSTVDKSTLEDKSVADAINEFALGKAAMIQSGTWAWPEISGVEGNTVKADKIHFLPLYMGIEGEQEQGLCIGTENYLAINAKVSEEKQKESVAFLEWLFSSEKGKKYVAENLSFITPFRTFTKEESPSDPLAKELILWTAKKEVTAVPWSFVAFPSERFKEDFGKLLSGYVQGKTDFEQVKENVKISFQKERAAAAS